VRKKQRLTYSIGTCWCIVVHCRVAWYLVQLCTAVVCGVAAWRVLIPATGESAFSNSGVESATLQYRVRPPREVDGPDCGDFLGFTKLRYFGQPSFVFVFLAELVSLFESCLSELLCLY